ncbi:hypothetical protein I312_103712 [Cryptococcus bacillisporus CA1280]|uniref:uncharacterized protein n=1 Tax=Cryptococcus bacillisporus CA1280 TaxID=1296109 RepID=UPI003365EDB0
MLRGRILEMNSRKTPAYARYTGPPSPASSVIVAIYYWEFDCYFVVRIKGRRSVADVRLSVGRARLL